MKQATATITSKGQVTIPATIRQALKLNKGQQITFILDGDNLQIQPTMKTLEDIFGSIKTNHRTTDDYKTEINEAKEEHLKRTLKKLGWSKK